MYRVARVAMHKKCRKQGTNKLQSDHGLTHSCKPWKALHMCKQAAIVKN